MYYLLINFLFLYNKKNVIVYMWILLINGFFWQIVPREVRVFFTLIDKGVEISRSLYIYLVFPTNECQN